MQKLKPHEGWEEDAYWVVKPETKEFLRKLTTLEGIFPSKLQNPGPTDWKGSPMGTLINFY